jgi:hypothetical protein
VVVEVASTMVIGMELYVMLLLQMLRMNGIKEVIVTTRRMLLDGDGKGVVCVARARIVRQVNIASVGMAF